MHLEQFLMKTYEYHETKDSVKSGYLFALFSLKNASFHDIKNQLEDSQLLSKLDSGCLEELRSIKVKKNLGSLIQSIGNFSLAGYTVNFHEGDICDPDSKQRYSSEMRYVCSDASEELGWPEYIGNGGGKCHYIFQWRSKWACSQCTTKQIKSIATSCQEGERRIGNIPLGECIILNSSPAALRNSYTSPKFSQSLNPKFVKELFYSESCEMKDDFAKNPVLQMMVGVSVALFLLIVVTILCLYKKYKTLKIQYSKLGDSDAGEIEMQTR